MIEGRASPDVDSSMRRRTNSQGSKTPQQAFRSRTSSQGSTGSLRRKTLNTLLHNRISVDESTFPSPPKS